MTEDSCQSDRWQLSNKIHKRVVKITDGSCQSDIWQVSKVTEVQKWHMTFINLTDDSYQINDRRDSSKITEENL